MSSRKELIEKGKTVLGIEFGSTRIKAVLIDENHHPIASGDHEWENRLENGIQPAFSQAERIFAERIPKNKK